MSIILGSRSLSRLEGVGGFSVLTAASLTDPGHTHTGSADAGSNMPPYYALAYIMKV